MTSTSTDFKSKVEGLEALIAENYKKFRGIEGVRRWLLISFPSSEGMLDLIGQGLEVPEGLELFFVDYHRSKPYIVDYVKVAEPSHGARYDKDTGAFKVNIPVRLN